MQENLVEAEHAEILDSNEIILPKEEISPSIVVEPPLSPSPVVLASSSIT